MSIEQTRSKILTRVWKQIAQEKLEFNSLSNDELETLVNLVIDAALLEIDDEIDDSMSADKLASDRYYPGSDTEGEEAILWEGRPFLSFSEHYTVTSERIRVVRGLLGKDHQDVELIRVQDLSQKQTLRERMLNLGDITILSHDRSTPLLELRNVRNPQEVYDIVRRAIVEIRKRNTLSFQEEM